MNSYLLKKLLFCVFFLYLSFSAIGQIMNVDSLKQVLASTKNSKIKIATLTQLSDYYGETNINVGMNYSKLLLSEARKVNDKSAEGYALSNMGDSFMRKGNDMQALALSFKALRIFEAIKDSVHIANTYNALGNIYRDSNPILSYHYYTKCRILSAKINDPLDLYFSCMNLSGYFSYTTKKDSALYYAKLALDVQQKNHVNYSRSYVLAGLGLIYADMHKQKEADKTFQAALHLAARTGDPKLFNVQLSYAKYLLKYKNEPDSSLIYANRVEKYLSKAPPLGVSNQLYKLLAELHQRKGQFEQAFKYQSLGIKTNDNLNNIAQSHQIANLTFNEKQRHSNILNTAIAYKNKLWLYGAILGFVIVLIVVVFLIRNNKKQQLANTLLENQKQQIQHTFQELKATQSQLIQSEKMASLGELTAGIAHEIQNPLNFVNNFSEVSIELISEMKEELAKSNTTEAIVLAEDIALNLQKINHHGKRADSIVKGMLQHSRSGTGQKEPTNINTLANEFLHLAYHGLRAKDKEFNADLVTHFDETLPKINVVPQDMGRVLLNLFTNAFYATNQRQKMHEPNYKPIVEVSSIQKGNTIEIIVKDNGIGIPEAIKDKILQPFFTTKPTGEGTGLGLSLSYDIIVKGHNGALKIASSENKGSTFTIQIPS